MLTHQEDHEQFVGDIEELYKKTESIKGHGELTDICWGR